MPETRALESIRAELDYCYDMGYDCEANRPTKKNCHPALFATNEKAAEWERGKMNARKDKTLNNALKEIDKAILHHSEEK
jgi:hypothetical protein